jgi:hypothetical protein
VFRLYELNSGVRIYYRDLIIEEGSSGIKSVYYPEPLKVFFLNQVSFLDFSKDSQTLFTENGYFDPQFVFWRGVLGEDRVGDLLPYEYQPN